MAAMKRGVPPRLTHARGFTLTELAIVLFIIALLLGSMMLPLSAQDDIRKTQETQRILAEAREALIGFAVANGRLPCPGTTTGTSPGIEDPTGGGVCNLFSAGDVAPVGFLPAVTLGLSPTDSQGHLVDGWNNPIRYGVTSSNSSAFTKVNGMGSIGMSILAPDLIVCPTASAGGQAVQSPGTATADCPIGVGALADHAVAVIYSLGPNATTGGNGTDETHNPNPNAAVAADRLFISHLPTASGSANGEFDDMVTWLSPNILFNRMVAAGKLP